MIRTTVPWRATTRGPILHVIMVRRRREVEIQEEVVVMEHRGQVKERLREDRPIEMK